MVAFLLGEYTPCIFLTAHYAEMFLNNLSVPEDVDVNWC